VNTVPFPGPAADRSAHRCGMPPASTGSRWRRTCGPSTPHPMRARLRKVTRNRGQFPSEQAALKVLYLAVRNLQDYRSPEYRDPQLGMETSPPGVHDLLRRTNPDPMTATITYTDGRTLPLPSHPEGGWLASSGHTSIWSVSGRGVLVQPLRLHLGLRRYWMLALGLAQPGSAGSVRQSGGIGHRPFACPVPLSGC
jgi:hypothetical protein